MPIKNRAEAREEISRQGISIRQWAIRHRLPIRTVYGVLRGEKKGRFGDAHKAAVLLGIKEGVIEP